MSERPLPAPTVRVRVPAKVNLFLAVRGRRPDGMHDIVSVMHTIGIHDEVSVRFEGPRVACYHPAARRLLDVTIEHDAGIDVPRDASNLAVRAARALADALVRRGPATEDHDRVRPEPGAPVTRIALAKRIPVGAGMAGGSADAAATLVALNELWDAQLSREEMRSVAADVGADVPFCVGGGTALATGTGTATAQVLCRSTFHWVVGMSDQPMSTAEVYRMWDRVAVPSEVEPDAVLQALRAKDAEALGAALHNDLEQAAFRLRPQLRDAKESLLDAGAFGAVMSGSGPTVLGVAGDPQHARRLAAAVAQRFDRVEVARSPAGGPEIVSGR
ncbi:MAG: 4-(cytidine 5'-diphospho)-2-C-methyl-D-erythritol kinase [Actinomycetota bacterium]|nr:4-(cytidine 5'-diphospho)-2-C-methyl-D-erythritol kinase [Actinomycetota bacterium]